MSSSMSKTEFTKIFCQMWVEQSTEDAVVSSQAAQRGVQDGQSGKANRNQDKAHRQLAASAELKEIEVVPEYDVVEFESKVGALD
ncbi:hypothetical protein BC939DRAFT_504844 [Gamsiella multidivaricata]|uniref:uncharacterized protein n=1 Tax=Gamsiella multidivaricata TaxID=101098 RepID=UPI002220B544|nr:uncharacterized protein BC939DRAFT_504844 [Gamsiella multidivaricata]KAI7820625.1 hypothetical protein BC939DRAFT_504844 [Gamsiella multidivaricata]